MEVANHFQRFCEGDDEVVSLERKTARQSMEHCDDLQGQLDVAALQQPNDPLRHEMRTGMRGNQMPLQQQPTPHMVQPVNFPARPAAFGTPMALNA